MHLVWSLAHPRVVQNVRRYRPREPIIGSHGRDCTLPPMLSDDTGCLQVVCAPVVHRGHCHPAQRWLASPVVMIKAPGFSMRRSPVALHSQLSRDLHDSRIALAGGQCTTNLRCGTRPSQKSRTGAYAYFLCTSTAPGEWSSEIPTRLREVCRSGRQGKNADLEYLLAVTGACFVRGVEYGRTQVGLPIR